MTQSEHPDWPRFRALTTWKGPEREAAWVRHGDWVGRARVGKKAVRMALAVAFERWPNEWMTADVLHHRALEGAIKYNSLSQNAIGSLLRPLIADGRIKMRMIAKTNTMEYMQVIEE
jgi:hypothetical protein|tara:strand:- start:483 stop:833 length:351 start_codon:yes stop_codon:yes gene_type:complete